MNVLFVEIKKTKLIYQGYANNHNKIMPIKKSNPIKINLKSLNNKLIKKIRLKIKTLINQMILNKI